jgi:hypothetical protein
MAGLVAYRLSVQRILERRVKVSQSGIHVEQVQYYHRAVGCQIFNSPVKAFLALEWLRATKGEETATFAPAAPTPLSLTSPCGGWSRRLILEGSNACHFLEASRRRDLAAASTERRATRRPDSGMKRKFLWRCSCKLDG